MNWQWQFDGWILVTATLCAMSCALLGNFLVLRRMSMMGDAISHAVLPGLAIAFMLFHSRGALYMFFGAAAAGLLTAFITQSIHHLGKVEQGTAMGVTFTTFFAVGLIMVVRALDHVDIDATCVLYGAIELVPMHKLNILTLSVPRGVATLAPIFIINVLFVLCFYKELRISSFDPQLATTLGVNAGFMHYLLMTLVAATTVASFESVGSILVIAMLIVPAATAHLLTDRLHSMVIVSLVIAAASAVLGHLGALTVPRWFGFSDTNTAGMMAVASGLLFAAAVLGGPHHGLISRFIRLTGLRLRIVSEDLIGLLYRHEEWRSDTIEPAEPAEPALIGAVSGTRPWLARLALWRLIRNGIVVRRNGALHLTEHGRASGQNLVRSHRLWETYLHQHLQLPQDHVHRSAEQLEHITDPEMQRRLSERANHPEQDPQGRRIP